MPGRATLDVHGAQAAARRRSALLVPLVLLAFAASALLVHAGVLFATANWFGRSRGFFDPQVFLPIVGLVALLALGGAAATVARLVDGGGDAVALLLGGVLADRRDGDPGTARLLNVVEEMAIAAGLPVPRVYVLSTERGLNAFAAGFRPQTSIVAVTRGAVDALTRDELQGVVAHELSHVLNGDVRLGTQLVAAVSGLASLAVAGRWLLSLGRAETLRGTRSRSLPGALGVVLVVAGSVGALFARLVQCAVSRQRELLADAAAVQFTRNPDGLADALRKIASDGSEVQSAHGLEAAHLLFADGGGILSGLLASHPPIEERIRRIAPQGPSRSRPPDTGPSSVAQAATLLAALPPPLAAAARDPSSVAGVLCAVLLDGAPAIRERQLALLARRPAIAAEVGPIGDLAAALSPEERGAVLALALPGLDHLERAAAAALVADLRALAAADGRVTGFEWAVERIVQRRLAARLGKKPRRGARRVQDVEVECLEVLSALAWQGASDEAGAQASLDAAVRHLSPRAWRVLPRESVDRRRLDAALGALDAASPTVKERVLAACSACAAGVPARAEAVRTVAAAIGCALPLVATGPQAALAAAS